MIKLLPHEIPLLLEADHQLKAKQSQLAEDQSEAVGTSDWHDNAAYDAVIEERKKLDAARAQLTSLILGEIKIIDYPSPSQPEVALGSLIIGKDRFGEAPFVIVGQLLVPDNYSGIWAQQHPAAEDEGLELVTPSSPLGQALLGAKSGENVMYQLDNGGTGRIRVNSVDQTWMSEHFAPADPTVGLLLNEYIRAGKYR